MRLTFAISIRFKSFNKFYFRYGTTGQLNKSNGVRVCTYTCMYVRMYKVVRECVAWLFDHATGPATPSGDICLVAACNTAPTWPALDAEQTLS